MGTTTSTPTDTGTSSDGSTSSGTATPVDTTTGGSTGSAGTAPASPVTTTTPAATNSGSSPTTAPSDTPTAVVAVPPTISLDLFCSTQTRDIGAEAIAVFRHAELGAGNYYDTVDGYKSRLDGHLSQEA